MKHAIHLLENKLSFLLNERRKSYNTLRRKPRINGDWIHDKIREWDQQHKILIKEIRIELKTIRKWKSM